MRPIRTLTRSRIGLTVNCPSMTALVQLLLRIRRAPEDKRARIQYQLLEKEKLHACPQCGHRVSLDGYRETRTVYSRRAVLMCNRCPTTYVLDQQDVV